MPTAEEKNWAIAAHIAPLIATLVTAGYLSFLVPLIILLVKGDTSPFIGHHSRQSLNFQLTLFLGWLVFSAVMLLSFLSIIGIPVGVGMACAGGAIFFLLEAGYCIYSAMKASDGAPAEYPAIPFLSDPE